MAAYVEHPNLEQRDWPRQDLLDLEAADFVRIERMHRSVKYKASRQVVKSWEMDIPPFGRDEAAAIRRRARLASHTPQTGIDTATVLEWQSIRPVLDAVYRVAQCNRPADDEVPQKDVVAELGRPADDELTSRQLSELARAEYIEATHWGDATIGPMFFRLTEKGLQVVAAWPTSSGDAVVTQLLATLDERIEAAASPDERSKLERLRDSLVGVGRDVFVGILTTAANSATQGFGT